MRMKSYMITTKEYVRNIIQYDRYNAYGNFLDRFKNCADNNTRKLLIESPPDGGERFPIDVAKLAATVEKLCGDYFLDVPKWVMDERYILKEPYYGNVRLPQYKQFLRETTMPEFAKRNIFLGNNCMDRA